MPPSVVCLVLSSTGERRKVSCCDDKPATLMRTLTEMGFMSPAHGVLVYDNELEDFVDLDCFEAVPNKAKIKITECRNREDHVMMTSSPTSQTNDMESVEELHDIELDRELCQSELGQESSRRPLGEIQSLPSIEVTRVALHDPLDYVKFQLPSFERYAGLLELGRPVSGKVRRYITATLFQACYQMTVYPTAQLYRKAADLLVQRYPHLADKASACGRQSWIDALKGKYKNERRKMDGENRVIKEKREKFGKKRNLQVAEKENTSKVVRLNDLSHLALYNDLQDDVDDNEWLTQSTVQDIDSDEYREKMRSTAVARQAQLRTHPAAEALSQFPFLKDEAALLLEFEILFEKRAESLIVTGVHKMMDAVKTHGEEKHVEIVLAAERSGASPARAVLQLIASCCSESLAGIMLSAESTVPLTPCLKEDNNMIYLDGTPVCCATSFERGLAVVFACFWIFNIKYPKSCFYVLAFIEKAFMDLSYTKLKLKCTELVNFFHHFTKQAKPTK